MAALNGWSLQTAKELVSRWACEIINRDIEDTSVDSNRAVELSSQ